MSRQNKKKSTFKIWIPVVGVVLVIIVITFYMIHDINKKIEDNNLNDATVENIAYNEIEENKIEENEVNENTQKENISVENKLSNVSNTQISNSVESELSDDDGRYSNSKSMTYGAGVTDEKERAIELVKQEWGEDDTVNFVFDHVNENGEYIIAVKDKEGATVKNYFRVDMENFTVELD